MGAADLPRRPLADKFLHGAIVRANAYQRTKFQLPSSNSFRDKEGVPKFNVRVTYSETFTYAPSTWQGKTASQISASYIYASMHRASCEYVFPIGFPLYVPQNGVFGDFEGEDVKILCFNPQKALLGVNVRLLVYRVSKSVQRPEL